VSWIDNGIKVILWNEYFFYQQLCTCMVTNIIFSKTYKVTYIMRCFKYYAFTCVQCFTHVFLKYCTFFDRSFSVPQMIIQAKDHLRNSSSQAVISLLIQNLVVKLKMDGWQ
jgi:hypothetical protein